MILCDTLRTNTDCPFADTAEVCPLTSFWSVKTALATISSIHSTEQCFIPLLIRGQAQQQYWWASQQIGNQSP